MASQALHAHCPSCSLALSSLNKHTEAVAYYRKALELDPDNETYKSNLKVAELRLREAPSPVSPPGTGRGGRAARGRGLGLTRVGGTSPVPGVRHLFNRVLSCGKRLILAEPPEMGGCESHGEAPSRQEAEGWGLCGPREGAGRQGEQARGRLV